MACGVAILALALSMTKMHLLERDGWQLFGELFSWLAAIIKVGVGISGCLVAINYAVGSGTRWLDLTGRLAANLTRIVYCAGYGLAGSHATVYFKRAHAWTPFGSPSRWIRLLILTYDSAVLLPHARLSTIILST